MDEPTMPMVSSEQRVRTRGRVGGRVEVIGTMDGHQVVTIVVDPEQGPMVTSAVMIGGGSYEESRRKVEVLNLAFREAERYVRGEH